MAKRPNQKKYAELADELGIPVGEIRRAFGEPPKVEKWFQTVLEHESIRELWNLMDNGFWAGHPNQETLVLLRILYHTRRMNTRWRVWEEARTRRYHNVMELALEEILRLAQDNEMRKQVIRRASKGSRVLGAAIRDVAAGRHRASQRYCLDEYRSPPKLRVLTAQTAAS